MRLQIVTLLLACLLVPCSVALAAISQEEMTFPTIELLHTQQKDAKAVTNKGHRAGRIRHNQKHPVVIETLEDAREILTAEFMEQIEEKVNWSNQSVLVFYWRGSGRDWLTWKVSEDDPNLIEFTPIFARTRDVGEHLFVVAVRKGVTWKFAEDVWK